MQSPPSLLCLVKTGFILNGTTFKAWCRENDVDPGYAHHVVNGKTNGPKAKRLRDRIAQAAGAQRCNA